MVYLMEKKIVSTQKISQGPNNAYNHVGVLFIQLNTSVCEKLPSFFLR